MSAGAMHDIITDWLTEFAAQKERLRDDVHVDQISAEFKDRHTWADAAVQCFSVASRAARAGRLPVTVAMELFLESTQTAESFAGGPIQNLALSWTPPALTVYQRGVEPWNGVDAFQRVSVDTGVVAEGEVMVLFQEWFDEVEADYDRRLWLVAR